MILGKCTLPGKSHVVWRKFVTLTREAGVVGVVVVEVPENCEPKAPKVFCTYGPQNRIWTASKSCSKLRERQPGAGWLLIFSRDIEVSPGVMWGEPFFFCRDWIFLGSIFRAVKICSRIRDGEMKAYVVWGCRWNMCASRWLHEAKKHLPFKEALAALGLSLEARTVHDCEHNTCEFRKWRGGSWEKWL